MIYHGLSFFQNSKFAEIYSSALNKKRLIWKNNQVFLTYNKYIGHLIGYLEFPQVIDPSPEEDFLEKAKEFASHLKIPQLYIRTELSNPKWQSYLNGESGTYLIDLTRDESDLWKNIAPGCRQKINKALTQNAITVSEANSQDELENWYELYKETGIKKRFETFPKEFLKKLFIEKDLSSLVLAKIEKKTVAGVFLLLDKYPSRFLAASDPKYYKCHPNNLLEWEVIRWAKSKNYMWYDLCQAEKTAQGGPGEFKRSFGGQFITFKVYKIETNWVKSRFIDSCLFLSKLVHKF